MIRYFNCLCLLALGAGLPLSAKSLVTCGPASSRLSNAGARITPAPVAPRSAIVARAKVQIQKKSVVVLTPDTARAVVSLALASKQEAAATAPAKSLRGPVRVGDEGSPAVSRNSLATISSGKVVPVKLDSNPVEVKAAGRLARVTAYWAGEGDYYTERCISATGVRLHEGHCAVDPSIIPYGSVVEIAGVGKYLAVDTGSAVISRTAAREGGHTSAERGAIVIDLFFEDRSEGERFAAATAKYASISWWTPGSTGLQARAARSLFADENWSKIQSKQL